MVAGIHEFDGTPSGLSFDIQKPELIYEAITHSEGGTISTTLLESPIDNVTVSLESDASTFDIETTIELDMKLTISRAISPEGIINSLRQEYSQYGPVVERGGHYIVQGKNGTQLILNGDGGMSVRDIVISTGKAKERYGATIHQIVPSPEVDQEAFDNAIQDTIDAIRISSEIAYGVAGKAVPAEKITFTPPIREYGKRPNAKGLLEKIEVEKPNVTFQEIGGQEEAKREIEGLAFALSNPDLYKKWGTKPPKGILLYGPPGTGKTLMAKALASQANARFFNVRASDIGSKWYGESEQLVQEIFDAASENGKTIIYFDEIDSIAPSRDGKHEATQKVIGTLLQNIDGLGASDNVMVVASTNRRNSIDPAMMRPGRLDRLVEVGLPDEEGREHILAIHLDKANTLAGRKLFSDLNPEKIAAEAKGFSGADIAEIVRRALEEKVRQEGRGEDPAPVSTEDLLRELKNYERVRNPKVES